MTILGIDPGAVSAAYAVLNGSTTFVDDIPVVDKMVDAASFSILLRGLKPEAVVIERVGAMPHQGVTSMFRFGMGTGLLRGVVLGAGIPLYEVTPGVWKKHFKLSSDKEKSRALAIQRYPTLAGLSRKKDVGRAEALLLALWFLETRHGPR